MSFTYNGVDVFRLPPEDYPFAIDFDNPRQQKVMDHYLVFGIGGPLAFIALLQRYYTKIFLSKGLQMDDLFMLLGWVSTAEENAHRQNGRLILPDVVCCDTSVPCAFGFCWWHVCTLV